MEAIHIQTSRQITNLDYNFSLNFMWLPFVNQDLHPSIFKYTNFSRYQLFSAYVMFTKFKSFMEQNILSLYDYLLLSNK